MIDRRWVLAAALLAAVPDGVGAGPAWGLGGPEVTKLDWNTRALRAADINADGRTDLVLLNNDRATITLLRQADPGRPPPVQRSLRHHRWEPVVEDARFEKETLTAGITLYDLAVGDLNSDGRLDLVYTGQPHALTVRYQEADGWREQRVTPAPDPAQHVSSLRIDDIDADGRSDLVMLGLNELAIFRQDENGGLQPAERFPLAEEHGYGVFTRDFNGDQRLDVLHVNGRDARGTLRVRLQTEGGAFGAELAFPLDRIISPVHPLRTPGAPSPGYAFVAAPVGEVQVVRFNPEPESDAIQLPRPRVFRPRLSGRSPAAYALGDYNGDGRLDVAASDADGAQLSIYLRQDDGELTAAEVFPSLSEARSLAALDWDGDGRDELFLASAQERLVARATMDPSGRLEYPQPLPVAGKPIVLAAAQVDGRPLLAVVVEENGAHLIRRLTPGEGEPQALPDIELPKLRTDPSAVRFWDANQDGRLDLALFVPRDAVRILMQHPNGEFRDVSRAPGYRKGLVDGVEPAEASLADVNGDGRPEMVVAARGFARALRLGADGGWEVVEQFNARTATAEVAATLQLQATGEPGGAILLYDRRAEEFTLLSPDENGVHQVIRTQPADRLEVVSAWSGRGEAFVFGADRFWWLPMGRADFAGTVSAAYVSDLPSARYAQLWPGDFDGDGSDELVAVDPEQHLVEVLVAGKEAEWHSQLHFVVFESDPHGQHNNRPAFEPREVVVADVTADGRADLVLLVHDRVLVYPQRPMIRDSGKLP